jgi:hypothetical protein
VIEYRQKTSIVKERRMKIRLVASEHAVFLIFFGLLIAAPPAQAVDDLPQACFTKTNAGFYNCYSIGDIDPGVLGGSYESIYGAYANFAWQDFLALNFPAEIEDGNPVPRPSLVNGLDNNGGSYTTVWETYTEARDMFRENGEPPPDFGSGHEVPDICLLSTHAGGASDVKMMLHRITKAETTSDIYVLDEYIQANRMGPVVDQNGNFARFAINFNGAIYNYVVDNVLFTAEGQEAFDANDPNRSGSPVDWPRGKYSKLVQSDEIGSIMVKAAWKILAAGDDPTRYHRVQAYIYNKAGGAFGQEPVVKESCSVETVGLVGFHIVHRTNSAPQWVWSTFEHADVAPWIHDFKTGNVSGPYAFFDPATCPPEDGKPSCAYNQLPDHPWDPERDDLTPTQVIRIPAPGQQALAANNTFRNLLRTNYGTGKTFWENYFLVDVQFPTVTLAGTNNVRSVNPAYPDGVPTPTFLPNSLIETYIQGFSEGGTTTNGNAVPESDQMQNIGGAANVDPWDPSAVYNQSGGAQRNTSSCIGCHGDSALVTGTFSNYVFSTSRAESTQPKNEIPFREWLAEYGKGEQK